MKTIQRAALSLLLAVATSCVAYGQGSYQGPPGAPPPDYRGQPGYPAGQPPGGYYPDDRGDYDRYSSPDWEVGFFYQELSPFGDWIYTYEYGWTWLPRDVAFGWRPYSYGRWVMSEFGWFWVSYEPFGWATYHYGRWTLHPRFGWIWCPGSTWGPAWVSWQYGQGYVGWAPLPPEVGFEIGIGLRLGGLNLSIALQPSAYLFVDERRFLEPTLDRYYVPAARNVTIIKNTTNITNYTYIDNRVVNRGIDVQRVERATGQRVRSMRVAETTTEKRESVRGDEVVVYKPSKQRLATVKVDENKPKRGREERPAQRSERPESQAKPERSQPEERSPVEVAPRVKPQPPVKEERAQKNEQKERQELEAFERAERQRLEKAQREELEKAKGRPQTDAAEIGKRHAEEKKALDEEMKRSKQQLEGRQQVERKASQQPPPSQKAADAKKADEEKKAAAVKAEEKKAADKKAADKKAAEKKAQEKKDASKGKKKPQSDEPPPPLG